MLLSLLPILISLAFSISNPSPLPLDQLIYENFQGSYCLRFLNRDGSFGCTSPSQGAAGSLVPLLSSKDVGSYLKTPSPPEPCILIIPNSLLTQHLADKLDKLHPLNVAGVITTIPNTPNEKQSWPLSSQGLTGDNSWFLNEPADMFEQSSFPVFLVNSSYAQYLNEKAQENKKNEYKWPRWGFDINSWMWGAVDAETCLRRGTCLPVAGHSVYGSFSPFDNREKIIVTTQIDSISRFPSHSYGALGESTGLVALLSAIHTLRRDIGRTVLNAFDKQLIFIFFDAEAIDNSGSTSFVEATLNFKCKDGSTSDSFPYSCKEPYPYFKHSTVFKDIPFDNFYALVDIGQLGSKNISGSGSLFLSSPTISQLSSAEFTLSTVLESQIMGFDYSSLITPVNTTSGLPPSSAASISNVLKKNYFLNPIFHISDNENVVNNPYKNSVYDSGRLSFADIMVDDQDNSPSYLKIDDPENFAGFQAPSAKSSITNPYISLETLTNQSLTIAHILCNLASTSSSICKNQLKPDLDYINSLYGCFVLNFREDCEITSGFFEGFDQFGKKDDVRPPHPTHFSGSLDYLSSSFLARATFDTFTQLVQDRQAPVKCEKCNDKTFPDNLNYDTICLKDDLCSFSHSFTLNIWSPGIKYDDSIGWFDVSKKNSYSAIVVSSFSIPSASAFQQNSPVSDAFIFILGLFSFFGTWLGYNWVTFKWPFKVVPSLSE